MEIDVSLKTKATISDDEVIIITVKKLCQKYDLRPSHYIANGNICRTIEISMGSHSRDEEQVHRAVRKGDSNLLSIIKQLRAEYKGYIDWDKI